VAAEALHNTAHTKSMLHKAMLDTVAALIIEPLGSIICGRSKPKIAVRSQVFSPQTMDPKGSIISTSTVSSIRAARAYRPVHTIVALTIEPLGVFSAGERLGNL
jgi:hypothetical protein